MNIVASVNLFSTACIYLPVWQGACKYWVPIRYNHGGRRFFLCLVFAMCSLLTICESLNAICLLVCQFVSSKGSCLNRLWVNGVPMYQEQNSLPVDLLDGFRQAAIDSVHYGRGIEGSISCITMYTDKLNDKDGKQVMENCFDCKY